MTGHLRPALRSLRRRPGPALAVVLTLALGIGAATAVLTVVDAILLRPLPYPEADRLVMLFQEDRITGTNREASSVPDYYDLIARTRSYAGLAAYAGATATLAGGGTAPVQVQTTAASRSLFPLLGVPMLSGRAFAEDEDQPGGPQVVILGEAVWRSRFNADPDVIGRSLSIDGRPHSVVGVAGPIPLPGPEAELWLPLQLGPTSTPRTRHNVMVVGRLAEGSSVESARRETVALGTSLEAEYPEANRGRGFAVEPLREVLTGALRPALLVLLGAVALVLLTACANAANIVLAQGWARRKELAVRRALGASTGRLGRQFLAESLVTTAFAALGGLVLAVWMLEGLTRLAPAELTLDNLTLDWRVLALATGVATVVAIGFWLLPTLQARRAGLRMLIAGDGPDRRRLRDLLVMAQVSVSVVLLVGAGLLLRSFDALMRVDPGFRVENVLKLSVRLPASRYPQDFAEHPRWTEITTFYDRLLERVSALPGVADAAVAAYHPLAPGYTNSFVIAGRETEYSSQPEIAVRPVSPGYFRAVGVPLRRGRLLTEQDGADAADVLLINEAAARRFFRGVDPVGQRVEFWGRSRRIVGVVGDERFRGLAEAASPAVYPPVRQTPMATASLLVHTRGSPAGLARALEDAVHAIDPELAVFEVETLDRALAASVARPRFTAGVLGGFAALAVLLASLGIHALLTYLVTQRTRELGIRLALGASRSAMLSSVVGRGLGLALAGAGIGLLAAVALGGLLRGLLFGVGEHDPLVLAGAPLLLLAISALASWLPARRATAVDPMIALRSE